MCRVLGVSSSGFYGWLVRAMQSPTKRQVANQALTALIAKCFEHSRRTYGAPRIQAALRAAGWRCSRKRVARLMKVAGIVAQRKRRRIGTTDSCHDHPVAANELNRQFSASRPDEKWLTDITYVATDEGWLYLAGVLDVYSRKVVGWAMDATMGQRLVARALEMALRGRQPAAGLLHHSDRGSQYAAGDYQQLLAKHNMVGSMSRRANCLDNAMIESFWATLKAECAGVMFSSQSAARLAIFEYIEVWYNRQRVHSALGYQSPAAFEQLYYQALLVSAEAG
jgi:putative transposase